MAIFGDAAGDAGALDTALADFASRLEPAARRKLAARIAIDLRKANAERIAANVDPDGQPFVPRKKARPTRLRDRAGAVKRKAKALKMFRSAGKARFLRREASSGEARVGFVGAMARIMRVHQLGQRDTVTRDPNSPEVKYPARVPLGFSAFDRLHVLDQVADHISQF